MSVTLVESRVVVESGDVILQQLIATDGDKPVWLDQNISAVGREPDSTEQGALNSEDAFLLGISAAMGEDPAEIKQKLKQGDTIYLYRPPEAGKGTS